MLNSIMYKKIAWMHIPLFA